MKKSVDPERLSEITDSVIDTAYGNAEAVRDIFKMRIAFWDKLTVLNAGTLALSFTAAFSFRNQVVGDGGFGYLFAAWKMFISSIVLALSAQLFAVVAISHLHRTLSANVFKRSLDRLDREVVKGGGTANKGAPSYLRIASAAHEDHPAFESIAHWLGIAAHLATLVGYVWLYKFARINLIH